MKVTIGKLNPFGRRSPGLLEALGTEVELTVETLTQIVDAGLDISFFGYQTWGPAFVTAAKSATNEYNATVMLAWAKYNEVESAVRAAFTDTQTPMAMLMTHTATLNAAYQEYLGTESIAQVWYQRDLIPVIAKLSETDPVGR